MPGGKSIIEISVLDARNGAKELLGLARFDLEYSD
jgi:hypothetical protein